MIYYWNFALSKLGSKYTRDRYNLMDILSDIGGL